MRNQTLLTLSAAAVLLAPHFSSALVTNQSKNETSEAALQRYVSRNFKASEFPFWMHVGSIGRSSGVYLGNGSVLTAAHVGAGEFKLPDGSVYDYVKSSETFFTNRDGSTADLCLFTVKFKKSDSIAKLKSIPLTTMPPKLGAKLVMMGAGLGSDSERGGKFTWNDDYLLRWGVNEIEEIYSAPMPTHDYFSYGFAAKFERGGFECQATPGDSGGAVFHYNPKIKRWELAGIIVAVDSDFGHAAFGNQTYIADPALFRRELVANSGRLTPILARSR
ncbi:MAG: trypsin-like serine protease [Verrucomicrobiota bacterium]